MESTSTLLWAIGGFGILIFAAIVFWIVSIMQVYHKAGKPRWSAIIPIYNILVMLDIVKAPRWWIVLMLLPIFGGIVPVLNIPLTLLGIVMSFIVYNKLAKAFGRGLGFTFGLLFLSIIFVPILAFGKSKYHH